MSKQTILVLFCLLQGYHSLDRNQVITDYQPILKEKAAAISKACKTSQAERALVVKQIQNETFSIVNLINSQIATLNKAIVSTKSTSNDTILECLADQEAAVSRLTATPVNETCWVEATFPDLTAAIEAFVVLASIPNVTIAACGILDPLTSQDDLFLTCISNKILDLDLQLKILVDNFVRARSDALGTNVQCLAEQSRLIGQRISEIELGISLCLS